MNEFCTRFITASFIGGIFWYTFFYLPSIVFSLLLFSILITILLIEWKKLFKLNSFWFWFIMPWYPILPFALMIYMNSHGCFRHLLYYLFVIVFAFDGTAYLAGTLLGMHKIIPSISPGKTVEGCIGGFIGALITFWIAIKADGIDTSPTFIIFITIITCALAFVGDIFESFLKRNANIKDSGNILPGHGGFLDRFDAVMFASFFFFFFRHHLAQFICIGT